MEKKMVKENKHGFPELAGKYYIIKKSFSARNHPYKRNVFDQGKRTCTRDLKLAYCSRNFKFDIDRLESVGTIELLSDDDLLNKSIPLQKLYSDEEIRKQHEEQQKKEQSDYEQLQTTVTNAYLMQDRKTINQIPGLVAEYVLSKFKVITLRKDEKPEVYFYVDGIYEPEGRTYIQEITNGIVGKAYKKILASHVIEKLMVETMVSSDEFFKEELPKYLPVQNGVLDIESKTILPFSPDYRFFTKINAFYEPKAQCPNFLTFLQEILPNEEDMLRMQELFGLVLYRRAYIHKASMWLGAGRNGKGRLATILTQLIGHKNVSTQSLQALDPSKDKFGVAELHKKHANICEEISNETVKDTSLFKSLTAGDKVKGERKFQHPFYFENYATLIFLCNEVPRSYDQTDAFFARWEIFEFPFQFLSQKDIDDKIKEGADPDTLKIQKPERIKSIMESDEEFSGILNWALQGLDRLFEQRRFSGSATIAKVKHWYSMKSNPLLVFIEENIEQATFDEEIIKKDLRKKYALWKKENNAPREFSDKACKRIIEKLFDVEDGYGQDSNGKKARSYKGVKWIGTGIGTEGGNNDDDKKQEKIQKNSSESLALWNSKNRKNSDLPYRAISQISIEVENAVPGVLGVPQTTKDGEPVSDIMPSQQEISGPTSTSDGITTGSLRHLLQYLESVEEIDALFVDEHFSPDAIKQALNEGLMMENPKGVYRLVK